MKLKKGSQAAKNFMAKIRRMRGKKSLKRSSTSIKLKRGKKQMARRKRTFGRKRRYGGKSKGLTPTKILVGAGLYGAVREKLSNMLTPLTSKIPLGGVADEAVLFGLGWFAAKNTSGIAKDVANAAMFIEAARMGEAVISGTVGLGSTSSVGSASNVFMTTVA